MPLRTRHEPFLLPLYPLLLAKNLMERGYGERDLFAGLPFALEQLESERFRLTIDQHEQFILRLIDLTGDPHLALHLHHQDAAAGTNLTMLAIANSGQISRALHGVSRYFKTITRVFSIAGMHTDQEAVMDLDVHLEHEQVIFFAITTFALFLDAFFAEALEGKHIVLGVDLPMAEPERLATHGGDYPFALHFGTSRTAIHFRGELLDTPMPQADPQTMRLLLDVCERQLQEAEAETSFVGRVKWLLINRVGSPPRLDDAARQLGISPRGLRRRLAEAGTTFQSLLDEVRMQTASRLLRESDAPVATIAYELGFGTPSDFSRAFRKWTGESPTTFRQT